MVLHPRCFLVACYSPQPSNVTSPNLPTQTFRRTDKLYSSEKLAMHLNFNYVLTNDLCILSLRDRTKKMRYFHRRFRQFSKQFLLRKGLVSNSFYLFPRSGKERNWTTKKRGDFYVTRDEINVRRDSR